MASNIRNFHSKGGSNPFRQRVVFPNNGGDPKPVRARLNADGNVKGSSVKVTNSKASFESGRRRHGSIGGGGAGQEKKY